MTRTSGSLANAIIALRPMRGPSQKFGHQTSQTHARALSLSYSLRNFSSAHTLNYPRSTAPLSYPRWINNRQSTRTPSKEGSEEIEPEQQDSQGVSSEDASVSLSPSDEDSHQTPPASSSSGSSSSGDGSDDSSASSPPGSDSPASSDPPPPTSALTKQSVPEIYPQVLALPITRRPLFPGFYKAVVVRNPAVVAAIKEMMKRGQPYLGAFLLKDENADSDIITDIDSVHQVGVFAQITSVFPASKGDSAGKEDGQEESLTAVLYPHRRIRITDLITPPGEHVSSATIQEVSGDTTEPANLEVQKLHSTGEHHIATCWVLCI
jgi:Lon-like ATP-dependent protease